jgi:hypothetical protein
VANTFTALAPTLFSVANEVAAEPFGAVDSINANFSDKGVAIGDTVVVPVAPVRAAATYTPAMTTTAGTDAIASSVSVSISANRMVSWNLTGEQVRSLENGGNYQEWVRQLVAQGMRTLRNEAESELCGVIYKGASRAVGTSGTNPFATTIDSLVDARKVLRDNGAPMADLQAVINTTAAAAAFKLGVMQNAYQAGTEQERRQGVFLRQYGFMVKESAGVASHTKGAGVNYDVDLTAGYAVGDTTIHLDGGTANTSGVAIGDAVTFVGDSNQYIVKTGTGDNAEADIVIGKPGLRATLADTVEMTITNSYTANLAFERNAVLAVMRPPLIPFNANIQQRTISDGKGMTYLLVQVAGDGMLTWRLHLCWGFAVVNPEYVCVIKG